ncbi:MAG: RNA 2',3'-cyclic phosphodiesterase [Bosea sp. (in: a-proteobacteria)]|uniref:RNA 2',3'-cyclic phosphodiesterase n=1 Tax=Bosea sp. (in: a-proteobacteria) TaxID=1871050 RepID=UPI002732E54A|nr:RNA 2',3'-cyclic phosphodiesterase [Bosea sp. (in: a-proteobacteria)]MDP3602802.1 RNA 2',3'-cyclic phosphodiesterase [Bosea sp. (in: a-proteobacteria)]
MPRLFTALEIPAEVALALTPHRGGLAGARWIDPADYHITLRFLGDVDRRTANDVDAFLGDIQSHPFEVTLDALGTFGGDKPRAVYARVQPTPRLTELQADLERLMRRLGLPAEGRKFVPHVTLARLRDTSPLDVAHFLSLHPIVRPISFTARRLALMSSRDSVGGGPYVLEAAYPLGPSYPNRPIRADHQRR